MHCGTIADKNTVGDIIVKNPKLFIVSIIALVLFGAIAFFMRNLLFGGVVATYEEAALNPEQYRDQWISYEVIACLGEYAEETETHSFIPTGHEYYYVVWMADGSIMPLSVSKKADKEYLDAMTEATYDYIDGKTKMIEMEPRTFIGTIKTQKSEALSYYKEAMYYMETTEANGWTVRYEQLDCSGTRTGYLLMVGALTLLSVGGIVLSFVATPKGVKRKSNPEMDYLPK